MSKIVRIATTVTARYTPADSLTEAYWLDGRATGKRENRSADITLDREDAGFYFSVFASPSLTGNLPLDIENLRPALDKIQNAVKYSHRKIDNIIIDLAESVPEVIGKKTIVYEGVRNPFYAGLIVKGDEMAAITSGRGCAYLYRNDALYPLTKNNLDFEGLDSAGNKVANIDMFSAGVVGNVKYSNIANLQVDDCFIVCNSEIMSAIGESEILRIFDEAYDQAEAAGMIMTEAASKLPQLSLQFMMGFVENIEEATGRSTLRPKAIAAPSRFKARSYEEDDYEDLPDDASHQGLVTAGQGGEDYFDDDDDYDYYEESGTAKKIAMVSVVLLVAVACVFFIWSIFFKDKDKDKPQPSASDSSYSQTPGPEQSDGLSDPTGSDPLSSDVEGLTPTEAPGTEPPATPTTAPDPTVPPTQGQGQSRTYVVQEGDTMGIIVEKFYPGAENITERMHGIVNANKAKYPSIGLDNIGLGWELIIP